MKEKGNELFILTCLDNEQHTKKICCIKNKLNKNQGAFWHGALNN